MLKKLNLDGTKVYETALACSSVIEMIDALLSGHDGDKSIGSEQGGIEKWDDFVIETNDATLVHIQAKRNNTDFSDHSPKRDTITQGKNIGKIRPLSSLDESLKSLADWILSVDLKTLNPKRKFK